MAKRAENQGRGAVAPTADDASLSSVATKIPSHLAVIGKGMRHNNLLLPSVLQASIQRWYPWSGLQQRFVSNAQVPEAFIGWGHKKSYQRAKKAANRQQLTTLSIEDGFLRSLDSGIDSRHALSVVVDDVGIYFDLTRSSRLEQMIVARGNRSPSSDSKMLDKKHAQQLITCICEEKLSKYNAVVSCPSLDKLVAEKNTTVKQDLTTSHVLLIDQVAGDASIKGAGADKRHFKRMLKTACRNHPDAYIWIKAHPAAKSGYLTDLKLPKNVRLLTQALNPIALLEQVDHVYTVSSHMGFEALMLGKEVHCFGVNWYSGWGLTDDSGAPQQLLKTVTQRRLAFADKLSLEDKASLNLVRREQGIDRFTLSRRTLSKRLRNLYKTQTSIADKRSLQVTLETLFYSAYIDYSRYVDPATKQACNIETAIDWLVTNRYWQARLAGDLTVYEFSRWKLPFVKAFVKFPTTTLFIKPKPRLKNLLHPDHLRVSYQQPLLVWGLAKRQQVQKQLRRKLKKLPLSAMPAVYCMEDGFIRSNGLGATLLAPLSVVIDQQGIYYDATQPSDLETLLSNCAALTPQQSTRVQLLQDKLLTQKVSKYNVGLSIDNEIDSTWITKAAASGKQRLLIVGQVEDDLSVQHCGSDIKTNRGLIERVRRDNPDAYLIYKPHPDIEAGLRVGKVNAESLRLVDAVAYDTAMPDCLARVDEVHTISSLTGFEALLRGLQVTCYGLPFYAGWGLTVDVDAHLPPKSIYLARRKRDEPLSLEQLIHCTLIRYPLYRLPEGHGLAQVEQVIDYLYPVTEASTIVLHHKTDGSTHSLIRSSKRLSLPKKQLSSLVKRLQRRAMTRFMQQRHQWHQWHQRRKSSSGL
ncbi:capsular polysaccharide biosynthesis protein [Psychrobacter sp. F1192]|uniref:Capsular polysaccharide biosynthesis protein n=1 Tax=Psychrobacter coccoides TaxID=2818440 RepID=A0ABS3NLM3_9GAMM|nr:capsular polysaccharide biosynthesis protein [Psychrobacter coccoides]MBO1530317.1 capsular polysaccharide biosynthesis protein [Psychrobacter coccoides]